MKFRVTFTETTNGEVTVEAKNEEEALALAEEARENGEVELDDSHYNFGEPEPQKD